MPDQTPVLIRLEGRDLPGRDCAPGTGFPGAANVHVAVQRKDRPGEVLGLQPGDAARAVWTLDCTALTTAAGVVLDGRYIQNRLGGRFIYLSWGDLGEDGGFTMFRRAKLMFDDIGQDLLAAAAASGHLTARLRLTDAKGYPVCARVRPPLIEWSAQP
jgi:hypothetical protein